jgi:hypothetical protein
MENSSDYCGEELPKARGLYGFVTDFFKWKFNRSNNVMLVDFDNVPTHKEPLIIVSNHDTPNDSWHFDERRGRKVPHTHSVDHLLIGAFMDQRIHALASVRHYRSSVKSYLLDMLEQVPATTNGIKEAHQFIDKGESILIFPEGNSGQGTLIGKKVEIRPGLGMLVEAYPYVRILPIYVRIEGKKDWLWPKFDSASVVFGEPFLYGEEFGELPLNEGVDCKRISEDIMRAKVRPLESRLD